MNYAELCEMAPNAGDALAFRARGERCPEYVITGEVAGVTFETPEPGDRVIEFAVDEFLLVEGGEMTPTREYLSDLPPVQYYLSETPRPAPLPALVFRGGLPLGVSLPDPVWRPGRVCHYDTRPEGTPVEFTAGEVVAPRDVLPVTENPTDSMNTIYSPDELHRSRETPHESEVGQ